MSLPVHVVADDELVAAVPGMSVVLTGDEARHAVSVRRLRVGEQLEFVDGHGTRATAAVVEIRSTGELVADVVAVHREPQPQPRLVVVQALAKGDRGETAVATLTEVGVDEIVPWAAERCVVKWTDAKATAGRAKWQRTAVESAKQARRAWFPVVSDFASTDAVVERIERSALAVVLHETAECSLTELPIPPVGDVVIVVGPEGGLTDDECARLAVAGASVVRAGSTVMRTSTAGTVAAAVILSLTQRWEVQ